MEMMGECITERGGKNMEDEEGGATRTERMNMSFRRDNEMK